MAIVISARFVFRDDSRVCVCYQTVRVIPLPLPTAVDCQRASSPRRPPSPSQPACP